MIIKVGIKYVQPFKNLSFGITEYFGATEPC